MVVLRDQLRLLLLLSIVPTHLCKRNPKPVSYSHATQYLSTFGYVSPSNVLNASPSSTLQLDVHQPGVFSALQDAIRTFQHFAHLRPTGELDETTRQKMAQPRCGVPDVLTVTRGRGAAFKWKKNDLTYSIESYSSDLPKENIRRAIAQAFNMWSEVTPLNLHEVRSGGDIQIKFASRSHGDPWPFDGRGGVLAHATMPSNGLLHFDDDENWVYMDAKKIATYEYTDLLAVAIHESGHTLGLEHSNNDDSIMAPFYQETVDDHGNYKIPSLDSADITSIQRIYGPRRGAPPTVSNGDSGGSGPPPYNRSTNNSDNGDKKGLLDRIKGFFGFGGSSKSSSSHDDDEYAPTDPTPLPKPDSSGRDIPADMECPKDVDGVTIIDGATYLFSGSKVFLLRGGHVTKVDSLQRMFPNGPPFIQGVYSMTKSRVTLLFYHKQVYAYTADHSKGVFRLDVQYPKPLPREISFNPMGAFVWIDGRQVLVNGRDFAIYDFYWNRMTLENKIANYFTNFPNEPLRGVVLEGNIALLLANNRVYKYDTIRNRVMGTPVLLQNFLHC